MRFVLASKIKMKFYTTKILAVIVVLVLLGSGCSNNPASGDSDSGVLVFLEERVVGSFLGWMENNQEKVLNVFSKSVKKTAVLITEDQKKAIDKWLENNNLNIYGDEKGTMYSGGTPLFNETTGETIDRFEYLIKKFPDLLEIIKDSFQE